MVGTTRFELATSPTPILEITQSEQLGYAQRCINERETTRRNAYWTLIGPAYGPTLEATTTRHERQASVFTTVAILVTGAEVNISSTGEILMSGSARFVAVERHHRDEE